jgi:hypothetical protein
MGALLRRLVAATARTSVEAIYPSALSALSLVPAQNSFGSPKQLTTALELLSTAEPAPLETVRSISKVVWQVLEGSHGPS